MQEHLKMYVTFYCVALITIYDPKVVYFTFIDSKDPTPK